MLFLHSSSNHLQLFFLGLPPFPTVLIMSSPAFNKSSLNSVMLFSGSVFALSFSSSSLSLVSELLKYSLNLVAFSWSQIILSLYVLGFHFTAVFVGCPMQHVTGRWSLSIRLCILNLWNISTISVEHRAQSMTLFPRVDIYVYVPSKHLSLSPFNGVICSPTHISISLRPNLLIVLSSEFL